MISSQEKKAKKPTSSPKIGPSKDSTSEQSKADVAPIFPVVGIGASAGGLEAFVQLLNNLDAKTGMAFVLVQHLDPNHESLLSEILGRATTMPVTEITNDTLIAPDHVYVMPPNTRITIALGVLSLTPRGTTSGGGHHPVDDFFCSLADDQREKAIGIVLSGTGSDGAKGVAAITSEGGIAFAQDPKSAKFDGMPTAAITSGVDFILTPAAIASELAHIARTFESARTVPGQEDVRQVEPESPDLRPILSLLHTARGMDFSHYKNPTVQRRILRRMSLNRLTSTEEYAAFLRANPAELDALYEDILVKVTSFFRNPETFEALRQHVFPMILEQLPRSAPVRVWVPGCATGEEAYSIAICLLEYMEETNRPVKIEIFATDVSDTALTKARTGCYDDSIVDQVDPKRLSRFFIKEPTGYRVGPQVRECCVFAKQNVARDPPFSRLDLISCRNLLIYLTPTIQKRILAAFHFALNPTGFLTLGNAETIGAATDLFGVTDSSNKIFVKRPGERPTLVPDFIGEALQPRASAELPFARFQARPAKTPDIKGNADRAILVKFVPPGVVVNERMEVLEVRGDTSPYLMLPPGELTANLSKMCRPGLLGDLRRTIHEAGLSRQPVKKDGWIKVSGQRSLPIVINVVPFTDAASKQNYFVVLFERKSFSAEKLSKPTVEETSEIQRFERELAETKEYLNAIIEKEQATNEELKSASEEILSANEELQSTNEEMATAKEETQATNEELTTVNDELQHRNQELGLVNNDLSNLFGSVQLPIVMLSENFVIRRFTQSAEKVLNLSAADLGKSLADVASKLPLAGLPELVSEVLESLHTRDEEVQDRDGRWYSVRVKPYRTSDNRIDGAVIVLIDIDSLKRSLHQLKEAHDFAEAIVQTTPIPLLVLDAKLTIITANQAFCRHFHIKEAATKNVKIYDLGDGQWNAPRLRDLLENILPRNEVMEDFTLDHEFAHIGRRTLRLSARSLVQQHDQAAKILLAMQDLTVEKRTEESMMAAKDAAVTANQTKSDFLANMSHEIRTPLGVILGYSEMLADPDQTKTDALHSATRIRKNVEHLTELIDEILDIAKIEAGKLEVERVQFELLPVLGEVFALARPRDVVLNPA